MYQKRINYDNVIFYFFKILFIYYYMGREGETERNINVWLPLAHPSLGTWPATQAYAQTGNGASDLLLCSPSFNPLSYTSQGKITSFSK